MYFHPKEIAKEFYEYFALEITQGQIVHNNIQKFLL